MVANEEADCSKRRSTAISVCKLSAIGLVYSRTTRCNSLADHAIGSIFLQIGQVIRMKFWGETRDVDALAYCQPVGTRSIVSEFLKEPSAVAERSRAFAYEIGEWVF